MSSIFNIPDRKAKRLKKKSCRIAIQKCVLQFRKDYPEYKHITEAEYRNIIKGVNISIKDNVLTTRDGVELPEELGYLVLTAYKSKKRLLDKGSSEKYGTKIYHTNLAADGLNVKVTYSNDRMKYKLVNRELWGFIPARTFKLDVSKVFKKDWKKFIQSTSEKKLCRRIVNNIRHTALFDPEITYNEFDI
jgi:hypothetical protein